ncbi:MAG: GNAT family N-acetyltransferase, partial [Undibacterium sp.]|nr:GNAT family N-acetyltransferase [Undibacterium sp.]
MNDVIIREIQAGDNAKIAHVIRSVLKEFNVPKVGSAYADPCLDALYEHYQREVGHYFVVELDGEIVAGAGFAALAGADAGVCELQKMYMLSNARGLGLGKRLIQLCIAQAKKSAYTQCYLETMPEMLAAQSLYQKMGFDYICK